jgi:hypothetical protein
VVGARRPSVTTALGRLQEQGLIARLPDGGWLLHGAPPEDYARLEAEAASANVTTVPGTVVTQAMPGRP